MDKHPAISPEGVDQALLLWMQELSPHGICVTDSSLRIQGWNLWFETTSRLAREQVVGRHLLEVFPELTKRHLERYFDRALAGEVIVLSAAFHGFLFPLPSPIPEFKQGKMLQTVRIAPLVQQGEIVGTITMVEDVTHREYQNSLMRRQHDRQELFSWALAHLLESPNPESIIKEIFPRISAHIDVDVYFNYLLDHDGKQLRLHSSGGCPAAIQANLASCALGEAICGATALKRQSSILSDIQHLSGKDTEALRELGLRSYVCHPLLVEQKLIGTLSFGSRSRDRFNSEEIEFTQFLAQYVAVAIDRSRRVEELFTAQRELSRHAESLEKKVVERTGSLQESISELQSFSYSLAHDVRAPLRHITGYAAALQEDCGEQLNAKGKQYLASILRGLEKLDTLTKDILSYSQVSQGSIRFETVDLETVLSDIISQFPDLAENNVLTINRPLHNPIGQRVLLQQCLSNLLDNAMKFVRAGVNPRITIWTEIVRGSQPGQSDEGRATHPAIGEEQPASRIEDSRGSRWVRVWIEDNGIGIPPKYYSKIFEIFERLNDPPQYKGTGVGLAIVAKAVRRMGGQIGVESEVGRGSKFWFQLPLAQGFSDKSLFENDTEDELNLRS